MNRPTHVPNHPDEDQASLWAARLDGGVLSKPEQAELDASTINAYTSASEYTRPMMPMPSLDATWRAAVSRLQSQVSDPDAELLFEPEALDDFLALVQAIEHSEPRFLRQTGFPNDFDADFRVLLAKVEDELRADRSYRERQSYDGEADASFSLAASIKRLCGAVPDITEAARSTISDLTLNANRCRERYNEMEEEEGEDDPAPNEDYHSASNETFNIDSVFADL